MVAEAARSVAARRWLAAPRLLQRPADLHGGHVLVGLLSVICAVLAIRLLAAVAAPAPEPVAPNLAVPADAALLRSIDPFFGNAAADSMPVTALPLKLRGVRVDMATGRGGAFIETADGVQLSYTVGDSVGGGTLAAVLEDHVVLDVGGRRETLWIDSGSGSGEAAAGAPAASAPAGVPPASAPVAAALPVRPGRAEVLTGDAAARAADDAPPMALGDDAQ